MKKLSIILVAAIVYLTSCANCQTTTNKIKVYYDDGTNEIMTVTVAGGLYLTERGCLKGWNEVVETVACSVKRYEVIWRTVRNHSCTNL